jgi:hypothetical protein
VLLVGDTQTDGHTDMQTDRETGDLITLISFLESRLKTRDLEEDFEVSIDI